MTIWQAHLDDAQERSRKLQVLAGNPLFGYNGYFQETANNIRKDETEARRQLATFGFGYGNIEKWRPMTLEQYQHQITGGVQNSPTASTQPSAEEVRTAPTPTAQPIPVVNLTQTEPVTPIAEGEQGDPSAVLQAVRQYASAMLANDSAAEARSYAQHVDKYYLRTDVDNQFVRDDKQAFLDHGNRVTSLELKDMTVEDQTPTTASVRYTRDVSWVNGSASTHKDIRSLLHKFGDGWKIVYEQDFP
jgi:hypothetical protein